LGETNDCASERKALFFKSTLIDADFLKVDVEDVKFDCTDLSGAKFERALNEASFKKACKYERMTFPTSFTNAFPSYTPKKPSCD
jgi:hypothetical protein